MTSIFSYVAGASQGGGPVLGPSFGRLTCDRVIALMEITLRAVEHALAIVLLSLRTHRNVQWMIMLLYSLANVSYWPNGFRMNCICYLVTYPLRAYGKVPFLNWVPHTGQRRR